MRLYAFLLFALFAIAARAASIPDNIAPAPSETETADVSEDKSPQREQKHDQVNTINDVDSKLRFTTADIPVEVIVEEVHSSPKTVAAKDDTDEIVRTPVDLNNPGLPQRQEHDSQNPEYYAAELNLVESYKKNINEAQKILKEGFESVNDGIQHMFKNSDQVKSVQLKIQYLQEGFVEKINELSGSIQNFLNNADADNNPSNQQTKSKIQQVNISLNNLKNDFTKGTNILVDGIETFASLKAENSGEPSSTATQAPTNTDSNYVITMWNNFQQNMQNAFASVFPTGQQPTTSASGGTPPENTQSDTAEAAAPATPTGIWPNIQNFLNFPGPQNDEQTNPPQEGGLFGSGNGNPIMQTWNNILNLFQPTTPKPVQAVKPESSATEPKPDEQAQSELIPESQAEKKKPDEAIAESPQSEGTTAGPIKQILQNNPISKGIANAIQRLQNVNNPEKPREESEDKAEEAPSTIEDSNNVDRKGFFHPGHGSDSGHNINVISGVEESETVKETSQQVTPEVQETQKEEDKEKTEQVVDKTE